MLSDYWAWFEGDGIAEGFQLVDGADLCLSGPLADEVVRSGIGVGFTVG